MLNNNQVMYSTLECDSTILRSVHGTIQNLMLIQIWQLYNNIKGTYKLSFPKEKRNINVPPETNADNEDLPTDNHTKLKATCIIFSGGNYSNRCYFFFFAWNFQHLLCDPNIICHLLTSCGIFLFTRWDTVFTKRSGWELGFRRQKRSHVIRVVMV